MIYYALFCEYPTSNVGEVFRREKQNLLLAFPEGLHQYNIQFRLV
jgi:hypothetical protein